MCKHCKALYNYFTLFVKGFTLSNAMGKSRKGFSNKKANVLVNR